MRIQRATYFLRGQAVALHVTGDVTDQNGTYYILGDHLGSANTLVKDGDVVSEQRFLPFGGSRTSPGDNTTPWQNRGYTGHLHNDEIGLIYMNARYYVPSIGRFASADTIVPDPTNPQTSNRFSYARNNPTNRIDPSGHCDYSHAAIENMVGQDCRDIVNYLIQAYGFDMNQIKHLDWSCKITPLQEKGGDWIIGYEMLFQDERQILVDNHDVYHIFFGDNQSVWSALIKAEGEGSARISDFKLYANAHASAQKQWRSDLLSAVGSGTTSVASTILTFNLATMPEPTMLSKVGAGFSGVVALGSFVSLANDINAMSDASQDIFESSYNAQSVYDSLTSLTVGQTPYTQSTITTIWRDR